MRIALASVPVKNRNIEFNLQAMIDAMNEASGQAEVLLFGESVLQGFDCLCWDYETDKHMAVAVTDEPIQRMCKAARQYGIAVSFGFIERIQDTLYSSQMFIGSDGEIVTVFHRVSIGWKEFSKTDVNYREGKHFEKFYYGGKSFAIGLCGDLWTDGRPEEMKALNADVVFGRFGAITEPTNGTTASSMNTQSRQLCAVTALCWSIPIVPIQIRWMRRQVALPVSKTAVLQRKCPRAAAERSLWRFEFGNQRIPQR